MVDAILTTQDRQEALSRAYVQAVAAAWSQPDIDRDSVDVTIAAGGQMRPRLELQLKATINLPQGEAGFSFPLKVKNYNDLRVETQTPRVLVVLAMPEDEKDWINVSAEQLILRKVAYWVSLRGSPESDNKESVTVTIPASNVFDVDGLQRLMEKSRQGMVG
jgi:Domain of unknown function (DUF4365)